jgi:hypothetical protein
MSVADPSRCGSHPWDVAAGRLVLDQQHAAIQDLVVDQLEVGWRHVREGLTAGCPCQQGKRHQPQPVDEASAAQLPGDGKASHGAEWNPAFALEPADLGDETSRQMRVFRHDAVAKVAENTTLLSSVIRCQKSSRASSGKPASAS